MVKAKHNKKPKPHKQPHVKKHGKQGDISQSRSQLDAIGLKIVQVNADGNCIFRSLADQLEGNEEEHGKYRNMVVQYLLNNREMFEPFIEDEVPFDDYCRSMEEDGTWAGHMELQAASLVTHCNICIHRLMSPRWYIRNFDDSKVRMIHLSYHDGEHYNSVRLKEDSCTGPARPIIIKADADLSAISHQAKATVTKSKAEAGNNYIPEESVKLVMTGSGCEDTKKVEEILSSVYNDVDAAIEVLIIDQGCEGDLAESEKPSSPPANSNGAIENTSNVNLNEELKAYSPEAEDITHGKGSPRPSEKTISRNKPCLCGSKKKYKACCGTVTARSLAKLAINQTVDHGKTRKERKQAKKGGYLTPINPHGAERGSADVGALCI